jgi:hypothetical protein
MDSKGGVSPLKLRASKAKSRRGGEEAGAATAKKGGYLKGRGGYKKSSGTEGTGVNRGGYNIHTRFKPRAKPEGPKGGVEPTPRKKPYSFDKDGEIVINTGYEYKQDPSTTKTTTTGEDRVSYEKAWEESKDKYTTKGQQSRMGTDENAYNVFANIDEYIAYMDKVKEYNKTEEGKEWSKKNRKSKTKTVTEIIDGVKKRRSYTEKNGKRTYTSDWEVI